MRGRGRAQTGPQIALLHQIHESPPGRARQHLIEELIRAGNWEGQIRSLASRWRQDGDGVLLKELMQAGRLGLLEAVSRWRPHRRRGWPTYAWFWVRKSLERLCRAQGPIVGESEHEIRLVRLVAREVRRGAQDEQEIARRTGLSLQQVRRGLQGRRPRGWAELTDRS